MNFNELFGTDVVSEIVHARVDFGEVQYGETSEGICFEFRTNLTVDHISLYLEIIKAQGLGPSAVGFGLEAFASSERDNASLPSHVAMYINRSNVDSETLQRLSRALGSGLRTAWFPQPEPTLAKMFGASLQPAIRIKSNDEGLAAFVAANPEATLRETHEVVWQTANHLFKIVYETDDTYQGFYYNSPVGDPCEPSADDLCYATSAANLNTVVATLSSHWAAHKDSQ